ncbi:MAG: DUF6308 family protein [Chloroflexota bacterium]|nr:DUF6308 family protein [Chloroflexota bacterium]
MNEPTIRLPRQTHRLIQDIDRCKRLIRHYIRHDAYVEYDWLGSPDAGDHDTLTRRQFWAIDGRMHAWVGPRSTQARDAFCRCWYDRPLPEIRDIPPDLDLVDGYDTEVQRGIDAVSELVSQMAGMDGVGDVAATKALHLLRPRFIAISDSRVRPLLGIDETQLGGTTDGEWYAARAEAVQRAIRALAQGNAAALDELHAYANEIAPEIATGLLGERVAASKPPVKLSKARVLDIVVWSHARRADVG